VVFVAAPRFLLHAGQNPSWRQRSAWSWAGAMHDSRRAKSGTLHSSSFTALTTVSARANLAALDTLCRLETLSSLAPTPFPVRCATPALFRFFGPAPHLPACPSPDTCPLKSLLPLPSTPCCRLRFTPAPRISRTQENKQSRSVPPSCPHYSSPGLSLASTTSPATGVPSWLWASVPSNFLRLVAPPPCLLLAA